MKDHALSVVPLRYLSWGRGSPLHPREGELAYARAADAAAGGHPPQKPPGQAAAWPKDAREKLARRGGLAVYGEVRCRDRGSGSLPITATTWRASQGQ